MCWFFQIKRHCLVAETVLSICSVGDFALFLVFCWVCQSCFTEGFLALYASAALATMTIASLITAPRFGIVDAEFRPDAHDVGFCNVGKSCFYAGVVECSRLRGSSHCINKFRATVWINGVIATMVGNVYAVEIVAFGNACCDGEHDAVAERHNRRLHILLFVMPFGNFVRPLQERTLELLLHKLQGNYNVAYA